MEKKLGSIKKIPEGYKQTEIGVIPEDWDVDNLGNFVQIRSGESPSKFKISNHGVPYFKVDQLNNSKKYQKETPYFVDITNPVKVKSLIFPKRGAAIYQNKIRILAQDSYMDTNLMTLTVDSKIDYEYLFYYLSKRGLSHIADVTSVPQINNKHIIPFSIIYPKTKSQQTAIVTVLSDTDALIEHLEKLIVKKKAIKKGTMQQLLTGKKRLPGFSREWEVKKLGELLKYEQPTKYLVKETEYNVNNFTPVLTAGKTFILGYTSEEFGIYNNIPVIIFDDFTTTNKFVNFPFKAKSSAMKMLTPAGEDIDLRFVYEKMQLIDFQLGGHKRYWISEYQDLKIEIPKLEEQTAIAAVLSDMDAELESLKKKRDKYTMLKQGMMQQLLTGRIRINADN